MVAKFLRKRWDKNIGTFDIYISDRFSLDSKTRAKYCNSMFWFVSDRWLLCRNSYAHDMWWHALEKSWQTCPKSITYKQSLKGSGNEHVNRVVSSYTSYMFDCNQGFLQPESPVNADSQTTGHAAYHLQSTCARNMLPVEFCNSK